MLPPTRHILYNLTIFAATATLGLVGGMACAPAARKPAAVLEPRDIHSRIVDNYRRLHTFRGAGKIVMEAPGANYAGDVRVAARLPDSLIVKVEAAFGIDVGFFFMDARRFASYAPLENTYASGRSNQAAALAFFHLEASVEEILSSVIGVAVPPYDSTFTMQRDESGYRFEGRRGAYRITYWVDPDKLVVKRGLVQRPNGAIVAEQDFSRFHKRRGVWIPQLIKAAQPPLQQRLTMFYERVDAGQKVAPAEFRFKVPASAKRVDLSAAADSMDQR